MKGFIFGESGILEFFLIEFFLTIFPFLTLETPFPLKINFVEVGGESFLNPFLQLFSSNSSISYL